jgi:type II secretory pathway component PulF
MSLFIYQAVRRDGAKTQGEVEAQDKTEAFRKLENQDLHPVFLDVKGSAAPDLIRKGNSSGGAKQLLTKNQIIAFTEELSDLLEAGLRLEPALRAMEQRVELSNLVSVIEGLRQHVREGVSFSAALKAVSPSFGDLYCSMVAAGELSGTLPQILRRQAKYLATMSELQSRVLNAMIYPAIISVAGIALMGVFMVILVPQLKELLTETGGGLPLPTRILITFSEFLKSYWWAIMIVVVTAGIMFWRYINQTAGRRWWDEAKLKLPLFGTVLSSRFYAQLSQTLATLVTNGVPLLTGLNLMKTAIPNVYLKEILTKLSDIVTEGRPLSLGMKRVGQFPPVFIDVVQVGEQTGDLGMALEKVALRYDKEVTKRIQYMTSLIQPLIIVCLALVVGVVLYSIIAGINQSMTGLKGAH